MPSLFLILSVVAFVCGKLTNLDDIAHRTIRLQAHEIDTRKADSFVDDTDFQRYSSRFDSTQKFQFLVHLKAPVHQSKLNIEKHFNVEFLDYIPHNTYVLMMNRQLAEQIDQDENVLFVAAALPEHRISIELLPRSSVADEEPPTALTIDLISNADRDNFIEKMSTSFGDSEAIELIRKSNSAEHRILIELKKDVQWNQINNVANHFAQQPETRWIEASHPNQSLNKFASAVMWTGDATTPTSPLNGPYDGTGVIVGILDNGIDASSCYFSGKINGQNSFGGDGKDSSKGHGTAMAGTCCGKGGTEPGVASGAKLHITDLSSDETIPSDAPIKLALEGAAAAQASVVVIAFGARAKWYNSVAADIDAFAAANPAITVVVAAGNDGYSGTPGIVTTAYSKNAIVVGAIQNALEGFIAANQGADANLLQWARDYRGVIGADMVASFSSRGPTLDGRLKPDIVAPGEFVVTAAPGACNQRATSGTSVSAAAVAGAAAIVHQYLGATRAGQPIRSATVKALLLHSGRRVASAGSSASASDVDRAQDAGAWPSNVYGYGRVALDDVIPRPGAAKQAAPVIVEEQLTAGASYATCYTVPKGGSLRATLVWTDAAGSPSAGNALVNDLNLAVWNDANGFEWRGNHKIEFDNQNSVEAVWINGADAGVYGVNVNAFTLAGAMQQFSLIISGDVTPAQCNKCPLNCSGSGTCAAGKCTCTGGAGGDCSIKVCPGQCSKNGVCDTGTGVCTCGRGWQGAGCETPKTPDTTINLLVNTKTYDTGISAGMFFGLLVLACIIGFGCALFCGGFIGARMMQVRRDRQMGR